MRYISSTYDAGLPKDVEKRTKEPEKSKEAV